MWFMVDKRSFVVLSIRSVFCRYRIQYFTYVIVMEPNYECRCFGTKANNTGQIESAALLNEQIGTT